MIIAEQELLYLAKGETEKQTLSLKIYKPLQNMMGVWTCLVDLPFDGGELNVYAESSLQALNLATDFAYGRMIDLKSKGHQFFTIFSEEEFCIESCFGRD